MKRTTDTASKEQLELGLGRAIDRRDFLGLTLAGVAGSLLGPSELSAGGSSLPDAAGWSLSPDDFNGYGGTGDYARSNGNTWDVVNAAHRLRDGFDVDAYDIDDTGERYDLVVVGGGPAGLGAAYHFRKRQGTDSRCLVLENHDMFGGLAKRNEVVVAGTRLMAPQGSNVFVSANEARDNMISPDILADIGLDTRSIEYVAARGGASELEFDRTNFVYYYPPANSPSLGFFFEEGGDYRLLRNPWANGFEDAPIDADLKSELMRWRFDTECPPTMDARDLDSMTFQQYLTNVHGFSERLCRIVNRFIGGGKAFNGEICSAYAMRFNRYPGLVKRPFLSLEETFAGADAGPVRIDGFPGGNAMTARYFVKWLIPDAIPGAVSPKDIVSGPVLRAALDRQGNHTRLRLGSTVLSVGHAGRAGGTDEVDVVYERGGRLHRVRAGAVVMATGAWVSRNVLRDAPRELSSALGSFRHAPTLVANVALRDWRFMERAGVTACLWDRGEFGFQCNLRRPIRDGARGEPLDPAKPIFLTFYAPFLSPGENAAVQTSRGRVELFTTPFSDFELRIRRQLTAMFGGYGFDAAQDIKAVILNRWGHAYVVPEPGFFFGRDAEPPARDVIRAGYGRIAFAHSELYGFQSYETAILQSEQAVERLFPG